MQEYIEDQTIALSLKASKLTAQTLAKGLAAALRLIQKVCREAQTPQGRQSVKKLMNHGQATNTIPLDGETRLFDKVARKWNVDYSFHETGKNKYLLLFKSGQADAITACFSEYTKLFMEKSRDKRLPVREQLEQAAKRAEREKPKKQKERKREKEVVRDDR